MSVDPPTTSNPTAGTINTVIVTTEKVVVGVVENLIIADVPWLGLPVLKQLWELVLEWIAGYFAKAAQEGATFAVIDLQVGSEENKLSQALANLIAAEKLGDATKIKEAIQAYADAQSALVHDDGSSPPK